MNNRKELKALLKTTKKPQYVKDRKCRYGITHRCDLNCKFCLHNEDKY
jgi:hypothetical protein